MDSVFKKPVIIKSSQYNLEGIFVRGKPEKLPVLLCAPHPLYGGNMNNDVIVSIGQNLWKNGHSILRFNYRGVGKSEGKYDGGRGETSDTLAALDFLQEETGYSTCGICGYSFGAWIALQCICERNDIETTVLISPPTKMMDFDFSRTLSKIFIVVGSNDEFCDITGLKNQFHNKLKIIEGADHFYSKGAQDLVNEISSLFGKEIF